MKVSVIIPTYNRPELLHNTLLSIYNQKDKGDYEVIVLIDDDDMYIRNATNGTVINFMLISKLNIKNYNTYLYKKKGWSVETYPVNVGIQKSTGDIIMLNSADTMSISNTINQHRKLHEEYDKKIVVSSVYAQREECKGMKLDEYNTLSLKKSSRCIYSGIGVLSKNAEILIRRRRLYTFQMSVRKKYLMQIGGMDESITGFYYGRAGADRDLGNRLKLIGLKPVFSKDIIAVHQYHESATSGAEAGERMKVNNDPVRNKNVKWGEYPKNV